MCIIAAINTPVWLEILWFHWMPQGFWSFVTSCISLLGGLSDLLPTFMYENTTIRENVLLYGTVDLHFDTILSVLNLFHKYFHDIGRFR